MGEKRIAYSYMGLAIVIMDNHLCHHNVVCVRGGTPMKSDICSGHEPFDHMVPHHIQANRLKNSIQDHFWCKMVKCRNNRKTLYTQHSQTQFSTPFQAWRKLQQQKIVSVLSGLQALLEVFAQTHRIHSFNRSCASSCTKTLEKCQRNATSDWNKCC